MRSGNTRRTDAYEATLVGADNKVIYRAGVTSESPLEGEFYSVRHYYGVRLTCLIMRDRWALNASFSSSLRPYHALTIRREDTTIVVPSNKSLEQKYTFLRSLQ